MQRTFKEAPPVKGTDGKPGRNEFKCYHCRKIFASKDGDWFHWNSMEVHLCRPCDKVTEKFPERRI